LKPSAGWASEGCKQIPIRLNKKGKEAADTAQRLLSEFESIFSTARRYTLLTELRRWDFHWEPLRNPETVDPNVTYSRGAPLRLSTGSVPGSSAAFLPLNAPGSQVITTGSGRRVGRTNYYQIQHSRFVDFERSELVPLDLAIGEFLEDMPACILSLLSKPEVIEYKKTYA
jgi:hypothetical protein